MARRRARTKTVRILGQDWLLTPVASKNKAYENCCGMCEVKGAIIRINPHTSAACQGDTFLHEVLHALSFRLNLGLDERKTYAFASGLLSVLRDNRDLTMRVLNAKPIV